MTDTDLRQAIAAERHELAAVLTDLPEQAWDAPTLCAGWRVREVVAHMTMPFRYSLPQFVLGMVRARGNFDRMADRCARYDAAAMTAAENCDMIRGWLDYCLGRYPLIRAEFPELFAPVPEEVAPS
ncbi:MAG: maleylpyruvate isomerase family mycothiol-dependent enzyme [Pseudonocardiaceae bacterium]